MPAEINSAITPSGVWSCWPSKGVLQNAGDLRYPIFSSEYGGYQRHPVNCVIPAESHLLFIIFGCMERNGWTKVSNRYPKISAGLCQTVSFGQTDSNKPDFIFGWRMTRWIRNAPARIWKSCGSSVRPRSCGTFPRTGREGMVLGVDTLRWHLRVSKGRKIQSAIWCWELAAIRDWLRSFKGLCQINASIQSKGTTVSSHLPRGEGMRQKNSRRGNDTGGAFDTPWLKCFNTVFGWCGHFEIWGVKRCLTHLRTMRESSGPQEVQE